MPVLNPLERARLEEELIALRNGSEEAYAYIHRVYFVELTSIFISIVKNDDLSRDEYREIAKDHVSEVFHAMWMRKDSFPNSISLGGWLTTSIRNRAINFSKKRTRSIKHRGIIQNSEIERMRLEHDEAIDKTTNDKLLNFLLHYNIAKEILKLAPREREVIELRLEEVPVDEIAAKMGISRESVWNYGTRAIKSLREKLPDLSLGIIFLLIYLLSAG